MVISLILSRVAAQIVKSKTPCNEHLHIQHHPFVVRCTSHEKLNRHSLCVYKQCMCLFLLLRTFIPVVSSGWLASALLLLCSPVINIFSVCHNRAHLTHNKAAHKSSQPWGKCTAFRFPAVRRWNRLQHSMSDAHTDETVLETVTPQILLIKDVRPQETPVIICPSTFSLYSLI